MEKTNIFLVDGASGTGKTDLVEYVNSLKDTCCLKKATTREIRNYEKENINNIDLKFYTILEFNAFNFQYQYSYKRNKYGICKNELDYVIKDYYNVFIIIRDIPLMRRIKNDYKEYNIITVYIHSDLSKIKDRLKKQNHSSEQIEYRLSRIEDTYKDYVLNSSFFDEVIINNSDINSYHDLIDNLINKYNYENRIIKL